MAEERTDEELSASGKSAAGYVVIVDLDDADPGRKVEALVMLNALAALVGQAAVWGCDTPEELADLRAHIEGTGS